jgi:AraC family transcriptional regulator
MTNKENAQAAPSSQAVGVASWVDIDTLIKLLRAASESVDSDTTAAKVCIKRAQELLDSFCSRAPRPVRERPATRGGLAPWLKIRVTAYIEANLGSRISASDLAGTLRLSTGHFFRAFRESFGEAPIAYITRQRIRRSQALMLNSRATLAQIAVDCGMFDQPHFTRVFRRIVGVNPSVWRREFAAKAARPMPVSRRLVPTPREEDRSIRRSG